MDRNPPIYTHRYLRYNVLGGLRATYGPRYRGQDQTRGLWRVADFFQTPANWRRPLTTPGPRRISVECPGTLLVALYRHDANTPAQDRSQLGVTELVKGAVVVDRCVDYLHGLAFEAVGDLLERPALLVLDRALDELLGQLVDLLALLLVVRIDSVQFEAQRVGEYLLPRLAQFNCAARSRRLRHLPRGVHPAERILLARSRRLYGVWRTTTALSA